MDRMSRQARGIRNNAPETSTNTIKSRKNHKTVPKGGRPIPRPVIHFTMSAGNPNKAMETKIQNK